MSFAFDIVKGLVFGFPDLTEEAEERGSSGPPPFPDVDGAPWQRFIKLFVNPSNNITAHFRYGLFEMTVRRLCDLGLMTDPHTVDNSGRMVWVAKWVPPLTLRSYLDNRQGQYEVFCASMTGYHRFIVDGGLTEGIGDIEGQTPTVSGLLAVAHRAGTQGLESWLASEKERAEFSHTTRLYKLANQIF